MDFTARYILIKPPSSQETHIERLKSTGKDEDTAKTTAESSAVLPESAAETFDVMLDADEGVEEKLSEFVFGKGEAEDEKPQEEEAEAQEESAGDQAMEDAPAEGGEEGVAAAAE